jgi:hypothetical protein
MPAQNQRRQMRDSFNRIYNSGKETVQQSNQDRMYNLQEAEEEMWWGSTRMWVNYLETPVAEVDLWIGIVQYWVS